MAAYDATVTAVPIEVEVPVDAANQPLDAHNFRDAFVAVLDAYRLAPDSQEHWERYWALVDEVAQFGGEALGVAAKFAGLEDPVRHHAAVDVMARLAHHHLDMRDSVAEALLGATAGRDGLGLMMSVANALGETASVRAVPYLLGCLDHPHSDLRITAAIALGRCTVRSAEGRNGLVFATCESDPGVRRWATYSLAANVELSGPEMTEALAARLFDEDDEVRNEAIFGLVVREDERGERSLRQIIENGQPIPESLQPLAEKLNLP